MRVDAATEATLLARVEAKHSLFPTYVYGQSKSGNPVIYKPCLGGLRDFRKLFVLQTDAYIIDLLLQATGAEAFTLVLDLSYISGRIRRPSLDVWESLRRLGEPLPAEARGAIEQLVSRVFAQCEAVVVVNATSVVKLLRPAIALMIPVRADRLFVSTDFSALSHVVQFSSLPKADNPTSAVSFRSNEQTLQLYELLDERAQLLLGRRLAVSFSSDLAALAPAERAAAGKGPPQKALPAPLPQTAEFASAAESQKTGSDEAEEEKFDDID
ncbi:hypothetical protein Efla_003209 [Eimeria flavescens]